MNDLIINNLKLVHFVIRKMNLANDDDYEDYYQVGVIGLIYGAKTYKSDLKITFSTYAYACIKNEILKYISKNKKNNFFLEEKVDYSVIEETVEDENYNVMETIISNEKNNELYELLDCLNGLEKNIIKMSYGIGCREYKQIEIAELLNIPQYKISRIKKRALEWLKNCVNNLN